MLSAFPLDSDRFLLIGSRDIERLRDVARFRERDLFLSGELFDNERFLPLDIERFRGRSDLVNELLSVVLDLDLEDLLSSREICLLLEIERFLSEHFTDCLSESFLMAFLS